MPNRTPMRSDLLMMPIPVERARLASPMLRIGPGTAMKQLSDARATALIQIVNEISIE